MRGVRLVLTVCAGLLGSLGISGCKFSGLAPSLAVVQTADLGTIGGNPKILGRDGGYSGMFAGNSVWVFDDTFLATPNAEGQTLISDSWAWTTDLNAAQGITLISAQPGDFNFAADKSCTSPTRIPPWLSRVNYSSHRCR